jgi:hypothetical protein
MPDPDIVLHMIAEFGRQLMFKSFHFLQADDIRVILFDPIIKSLTGDSTDSIHISRSDFHDWIKILKD